MFELVAFYLYTGARQGEVRRAEIADLHFDASPAYPMGWIRIHGTKTDGAERVVPMHPHHREILLAYLRRIGRRYPGRGHERVGDRRLAQDS